MKTMVLTGIRRLEMAETPDPEIRDDRDVLIRMGVVGVCGSDVHYYKTGRIGSQVVQYPYAVGHECAGTVEAVGPSVTRVKPGDRVAVDPAMPCFDCDQCRVVRHHTCRRLRFLGCPGQAEGCMSQWLVMPETSCFPLAPSMTLQQGALSEPLAIGLYAARLSALAPGAAIGVLGLGPIGLSVLLSARAMGAENIYGTDKIDERLALAMRAGAAWTGNPGSADVVAEINAAEPEQMDFVFDCCGEQDALDQAVEILKPGGTLMIIGIPEVDRISFPIDQLRRKELRIQNVRRQNECAQAALDLIADGRADADIMVTHHFRFEDSPEAFELVSDYRDGVVKAMVEFE